MTTHLQNCMIDNIVHSEYQPFGGRGEPESFDQLNWVWAEFIIECAQDKGTFTSLVNAGLAEHDGAGGKEAAVRITRAGFDVYKANKKASEKA